MCVCGGGGGGSSVKEADRGSTLSLRFCFLSSLCGLAGQSRAALPTTISDTQEQFSSLGIYIQALPENSPSGTVSLLIWQSAGANPMHSL